MLVTDPDGQYRQSYYSNSASVADATGTVFLDQFQQAMADGQVSQDADEEARSVISLQLYTPAGESVAFALDTDKLLNEEHVDEDGNPVMADRFFDDRERTRAAILAEYQKLVDAGLTSAELSEEDLADITQILTGISGFAKQDGQAFYAEENSGRYELASGVVFDVIHQELVYNKDSGFDGNRPKEWTQRNQLSGLPGFEAFQEFGYENLMPVGPGTGVDDNAADNEIPGADGVSETDGAEAEAETETVWDTFRFPQEAFSQYLFADFLANPQIIRLESEAENNLSGALDLQIADMLQSGYSVTENFATFENIMPYMAQVTSIIDDPNTTQELLHRLDLLFDRAFINENYSIKETGIDAVDQKLRNLRGLFDRVLEKVDAQIEAMDQFNEDNPFDPSAEADNEIDAQWEALNEEMRQLTQEFFGEYAGEQNILEFIDAHRLAEGEDNPLPDNSSDLVVRGPRTGVAGTLNEIFYRNPYGIPADSAAEGDTLRAFYDFHEVMFGLVHDGAKGEDFVLSYEGTLPYLNKALTELQDPASILLAATRLNETFQGGMLNEDMSVPREYEPDFADMVRDIRDNMNIALRELTRLNEEYQDTALGLTSRRQELRREMQAQAQVFADATQAISYEEALDFFDSQFS